MKRRFYSKLSLLLCSLLLFLSFPMVNVHASNVQNDSTPIFGLTADDVVAKYNQLSSSQKTQVLNALGNTSIFSNSLFGNIFNSTFGALDDAVQKIGDLFFQANGVIYKLGSSALSWVSRLIDKVFNNDLNDLNISQPVVNDFYLNTRGLSFEQPPFWVQPHKFSQLTVSDQIFNFDMVDVPDSTLIYGNSYPQYTTSSCKGYHNSYNGYIQSILVDLDLSTINFYGFQLSQYSNGLFYLNGYTNTRYFSYDFYGNPSRWHVDQGSNNSNWLVSFNGDYHQPLLEYLNKNFMYVPGYYLKSDNIVSYVVLSQDSSFIDITNNTYYNYIYNIPDQTPLNVTNIVSNTAIDYSPVENIITYLPDNYDIDQNFTVVNNYYISSGSSVTGSPIDVNVVSPGVFDVRIINPDDISSTMQNVVNKQIYEDNDINFGDLNFSPKVTIGLNAAKDSVDGIVVATTSSIIASMLGTVPTDWTLLIIMFLAACICVGFGRSIITH